MVNGVDAQPGQGTALAPDVSVIIPASNEQDYIGACLDAVLRQTPEAGRLQVIVAANACRDQTEQRVTERTAGLERRGWKLHLLSIAEPGKTNALNRADAVAKAQIRVYLDADVICDPDLIGQLRAALNVAPARYTTGTLQVAPARSRITRGYARFWQETPFVKGGAVGAGLFAVNAAGRARWGEFPAIISDDTFVRLQFSPDERIEVPARYHWPMVEGLGRLIRVRRRQDAGVREIAARWPDLLTNEGKAGFGKSRVARLALRDPFAFGVYGLVHLATRLKSDDQKWSRGR